MICVLFISSFCKAQYRNNKTKYDYHTYTYQAGDKYNISAAGVSSYFIPGLGQISSGETVRGFVFFGGYSVCMVGGTVGMTRFLSDVGIEGMIGFINFFGGDINNDLNSEKWLLLMVPGLIGGLTIKIWSIVDAVHVAKVNNLALRDKNKTSYNLQIQPYINTTCYNQTGSIPTGVTLKIKF